MNLRVFFLLLFTVGLCSSQEDEVAQRYSLDLNAFYGSILLHNPDISHLITEHPAGIIFSYNRKTFGEETWQQAYNYPDLGASLIYQNSYNNTLGDNYGIYAHFNFYFLKRNLQFRIGQGMPTALVF